MTIDRAHAQMLLEQMVLVRRFEERCVELYSEQKIRGFLHLYIGEEAVAVGALAALTAEDSIVATYREHGHALVRGTSPSAVMAEMFGKANGCARGRGGSMHIVDVGRRFYGGYAIVAGGLPIAVGLALADKMNGRNRVTACFLGDGSVDEGEFHEALNLASLWRLPVLFLCENNYYAMGTSLARHQAQTEIDKKPPTYGIESAHVDGMDVLAVETATRAFVEAMRNDGAPRFLELRTYRFRAHSMYDVERYRDRAEVEAWKRRDPIEGFIERMRSEGVLSADDYVHANERAMKAVDGAVREAEAGELEPIADLGRDVYAGGAQ